MTKHTDTLTDCPNWKELAACRLIKEVVQDEELRKYVPLWTPGKREPDRVFLWTLLTNKKPEVAKTILKKAIDSQAKAHLKSTQTKNSTLIELP